MKNDLSERYCKQYGSRGRERWPLGAPLTGRDWSARDLAPVLALARHLGLPAPGIDQDEAISRADAIAILNEVFGYMFPGLHEA
jgi:hypothetical protein